MQSGVLYGASPYGLPLNYKLLPEYLNDLGYKSVAVGKWHLGSFSANYTPTYRGFHSFLGHWTGRIDYYDHTSEELKMRLVSIIGIYIKCYSVYNSCSFICTLY